MDKREFTGWVIKPDNLLIIFECKEKPHDHAVFLNNADSRNRTSDLLITNELLCQLSYIGRLLNSMSIIIEPNGFYNEKSI